MQHKDKIDTEILNNLIFGRVEPQIYAFTTETIPNYLKVGDTYRPIEKRLNEWRKYFPNLEKKYQENAKVDDEIFFRDFSIHKYLEDNAERVRLLPNTISSIPYYSNEFFKDATTNDLDNAISDIKESYDNKNNVSKYNFYKFEDRPVTIIHTYQRIESFTPRPNQQETIDKFKEAIKNKRNNLLMYAVMRFGKSFTSMCCAVEMNARVVLIVSAKADVKEEWKKTVESHINFDNFDFLDSDSLLKSDTIIEEKIESNKKIALFLTLQDLQGDLVKIKHRQVFENQIDLLLIDETHFAARAENYGKVLKGFSKEELKSEEKLSDETLEKLDQNAKKINSKVRIHLSGTPYRILMNSEFTDEDIIAFYQFTNIAEDQKRWDDEHLIKDEVKEWDNPYYGFPQMIRFAFNPNESSRKKIEDLKKSGFTHAFSELLRPISILKDDIKELHKKFTYEKEVLDLFKVIDGSKDDNDLLGFLDYDKLKNGKMCRHIVCVLPYRASCDALEELIRTNQFKNLNSYNIINISGVSVKNKKDSTLSVISKISKYESENKKTLTLTVNRMLTGSTVPQWDTMLYLKDTASPQEYDQAIFRLQSQFIKVLEEPDGDVVKYNMKPQTLLVDFNPSRMFKMQEQKSQIYNANVESNGNNKLEERIQRELEISPIVVINKNKMVQVEPTDILDEVRRYSSNKSVSDEALSISVDYSLLDIEAIKAVIDKQAKIGSKQGLEFKSSKGDGGDLDIDSENNNKSEEGASTKNSKSDKTPDYKAKFAMYYARILFLAFLTDSKVMSLNEIISVIRTDKDNQRIASNLDLELQTLILFQKHLNPFILSELDYKIYNINSLANDFLVSPIDRASNAMKRFMRLSESEVVTPELVAEQLINIIPKNSINKKTKILDIASKQGEFVYAVYKKFGKEVADNFHSIPTSKTAYEFTRKVYSLLNLDVKLIERSYISSDLIVENKLIIDDELMINNTNMKFDAIVGNPPYQKNDGGAQASAKPIYNEFFNIAKQLDPTYISMIMPTRWYAGGKGLDSFRDQMLNDINISELHDFLKPELIFPNTNLRGGVCYLLRDKNYDNSQSLTKVFTYNDSLNSTLINRSLKTKGSDILIRHAVAVDILQKIKSDKDFQSFEDYISSRKPFGLEGNIVSDPSIFRPDKKGLTDPVLCYGKGMKIGYLEKNEITKNKIWIDRYKVFAPYANNIGTELNDDNLNSFIGEVNTISTETYIVIGAELELSKDSANNLIKYFSTKLVRFMHSLSKVSQHGTAKTYKFVPFQDFKLESEIDWSKSIEEIDVQLYKKYQLTSKEVDFIENMIKPM